MNKDWSNLLERALAYFICNISPQLKKNKFYPEQENILRAFKECPLEELKVVMLGQDPYHDGSATGLCFDNKWANVIKTKYPPSLKNILSEANDDIGRITSPNPMIDSDVSILKYWPEQGVLMLNTALTVLPKQAGSHTELWKPFTKLVIEALNSRDDLVWILWGKRLPSSGVILR